VTIAPVPNGSGSRSLVAGANALFRAKETSRPASSRILEDRFAARLAERDPRISLVRAARFAIPPLFRAIDELQTAHCVRHRAIDELLLGAVRDHGASQVVIVGAGYDMRASRFADRLAGVRFVEIDHPATMARKVRRLASVEGVRAVERVPLDLQIDSLGEALRRLDVDRSRPTCIVAEGLIHYLSRPRFDQFLDDVAAGTGPTRFVFSFIHDEMYLRANPLFLALVTAVREVPALSFQREELAALFRARGFEGFRSWTGPEQVETFAPEARGRPFPLSQEVAEATRR
jgi:methyltransferase (TIGR00027 family)